MALQGPEELGEQVEEPEDLDDQDASSISPAEEITLPPGPGGDGDDEPEEALLLPWDRFSTWLHCICVVGFDLELGQAVEVRQEDQPGRDPLITADGKARVGIFFRGGFRLAPGPGYTHIPTLVWVQLLLDPKKVANTKSRIVFTTC